MSIRTQEGLYDELSSDLIWRKKEISTFKTLVSRATPDRRSPLLRAGLSLVYAHWEGFVKVAGNSYLEFLHYKRLKYVELAPNFVALATRGILRKAGASNKIAVHLEVVRFLLTRVNETSHIPYVGGVDTGSNLSSEVLKEITIVLGLDYSPFESKARMIDERLLRSRNSIAHGEYLEVDEASFDEISDEVIGMLEAFRAQIDNAVALKLYRSTMPAGRNH
jgi:hypothetical protein